MDHYGLKCVSTDPGESSESGWLLVTKNAQEFIFLLFLFGGILCGRNWCIKDYD